MLFIFISPQFLINHQDRSMYLSHEPTSVRSRLLPWTRLTFIFMCSTECCSARTFMRSGPNFWRIYGNQPCNRRPRLIALPATFPTSYVWLLSTLLTVDLNRGDCILQGSLVQFQLQEIDMQLVICSSKAQFVLKGLTLVVDFFN